jgi:U3 small nucleolar RNA-associated protein 21
LVQRHHCARGRHGSLQNFTLGDHVLKPASKAERGKDPLPDAPVTTVAMSSCGNYGLVGTASGRVDRYNMQSGLHRGAYSRCDLCTSFHRLLYK